MEILNNKASKIEENPPKYIEEWRGSKPCKWLGGKKIIGRYNDGTGFGRIHFPSKYSEEATQIPGKKPYYKNILSIEEGKRTTSIKYIQPINSENKTFYSKRHYLDILPTVEANHKNCLKTFYPESYAKTYDEIGVEEQMGPKGRIRNLSEMRNGFPVSAPGDKSYKNPEYSASFYKEGGLIPGSTNVFNYRKNVSRKNYYFYETLNLDVKILDPKKLWKNKEKQDFIDYDTNYVKMLNIWDKTVGKELMPVKPPEIINKNASGTTNKSPPPKKK